MVYDECRDVEPVPPHAPVRLAIDQGRIICAEEIVLCTHNKP